jgi:hypothetical protein
MLYDTKFPGAREEKAKKEEGRAGTEGAHVYQYRRHFARLTANE